MTTHPHLEGLIPDRLLPDDGNGDEDAYNSGWNACIAEVARRLAALPGGGVDDAMVNRAARALCRRQADECNVDYDDTWKVYGDSFIDDAIAALTAAFTPTPNPHEADRNGRGDE